MNDALYQQPGFVGGILMGIIIALYVLMIWLSAKELVEDLKRKRSEA